MWSGMSGAVGNVCAATLKLSMVNNYNMYGLCESGTIVT